jgi:hypothetical protein
LKAKGIVLKKDIADLGFWKYVMVPAPDEILIELFQVDKTKLRSSMLTISSKDSQDGYITRLYEQVFYFNPDGLIRSLVLILPGLTSQCLGFTNKVISF